MMICYLLFINMISFTRFIWKHVAFVEHEEYDKHVAITFLHKKIFCFDIVREKQVTH